MSRDEEEYHFSSLNIRDWTLRKVLEVEENRVHLRAVDTAAAQEAILDL